MRGIVAIAVAVLVVGCSLSIQWDDFTAGREGAPDATTTGSDATANDGAASDASTDDGSGPSTDGGAPANCDGGAYLLCATFDQGSATAGWTGTELESGGTLGLSTEHRSPPNSLRAQLPVMTTSNNQTARVFAKFTGALKLRVAFDVHIATPPDWNPSSTSFAVVHVVYSTSNNASYLFRGPDETTLSIEQNGQSTRYPPVEELPFDKWVRVTLEIAPTTPTGSLRLFYDGKKIYENTSVSFSTPTAPDTYVLLGLTRFSAPSPALDVLYDNVTIEQLP